MVKSIRILLLGAVIQISFGSCLLWKGGFLSLKHTNAYFLILIVGVAAFCAGINYLHTSGQARHSILYSERKAWLIHSLLLIINLLATCHVLSESIQVRTEFQQELVDLFLPSFFFLLGIDLLIFLPLGKFLRYLERSFNKKKTVIVSVLATIIFLRNPIMISSVMFYIGIGFLCAHFLFPRSIQREISFYGHVIRDILFVGAIVIFF
ncbi:Immunity factor ComM [Streptococcus oralis]|uniref:Immunity factor ComM n=1 Tax=Streptococcus oralis TaxID=1303 RepID=A0A139RPE0_STROR|nr:hypothetical protein [Streptococcus oralis]KXU16578.1 Immunity factor ComM [Streptococcus oralis]